MKKLLIFALFLTQCSSAQITDIQPTSIDVEDFNEQIIELSELPFSVVIPDTWTFQNTGFEHQLWKTNRLQITFAQKSTVLHIPDDAKVISSLDNSEITSFCLNQSCLIQMNGESLYEAQVLTNEGFDVLERLR
jgi:hypothetical protein